MLRREALNVAGICDQSDRFNCKYCPRAGRDCEGATGPYKRLPSPGMLKPRRLTGEEYFEWEEPPYYIDNGVAIELPGPMRRVTLWRYHYSDGTSEDVTVRRPGVGS